MQSLRWRFHGRQFLKAIISLVSTRWPRSIYLDFTLCAAFVSTLRSGLSKTRFSLSSRSKLTKKKSKFASKFHNLFNLDHRFEGFALEETHSLKFFSLCHRRLSQVPSWNIILFFPTSSRARQTPHWQDQICLECPGCGLGKAYCWSKGVWQPIWWFLGAARPPKYPQNTQMISLGARNRGATILCWCKASLPTWLRMTVPELDAVGFCWLGTWDITKTTIQETQGGKVVSCHVTEVRQVWVLEDIEFVWFPCESRTCRLSEGTSSSDWAILKVSLTMGRTRWVSIARSVADFIFNWGHHCWWLLQSRC